MRRVMRSGRARDWLRYAVIAIVFVATIAAFAVHDADTGDSRGLPLEWLGFVGTTAIVFGYAIRACRRWWRMHKFWLLLTVFFIAHVGVGLFVLTKVDRVALVVYAIVSGVEYAVLTAYLGVFLYFMRRPK
jgi:hypothetical protein